MRGWLRVFWGILCWRRGPRDLPASHAVLALAALAYLLTSWAQAALVYGAADAPSLAVGDLALTGAVSSVCLLPGRRWTRVPQTLSAVLGAEALLSLPMIILLLIHPVGAAQGTSAILSLVSLLGLVWSALVMAKIISDAMDKPLVLAMGITLIYFSLSYLLLDPMSHRMGG